MKIEKREDPTRKCIKLSLYLWTDTLEKGEAFDAGCVYVPAEQRKAKGGRGTLWNRPSDLPAALLKELEKAGIVVHKMVQS